VPRERDELYADLLTPLVVLLAERRIRPPANPVRLLRGVREIDIVEAGRLRPANLLAR